MIYPPQNTISVADNRLGLIEQGDDAPVVIGTCSAGTANVLTGYTSPVALRAALGHGPAVEQALACLLGAGRVRVLKTAGSTAGAAGSVTKTPVAGGTGTGTVTVAGAAYDAYRVIVLITFTGTLGAAKFMFSLDGGYTYSEEILMPSGGTYAIANTNLTLTFVPGAGAVFFEAGDSHTFTCTAPHYTTSDLATAMAALPAQLVGLDPRRFVFAGQNASASAAATMAAAVATHMTTLESGRWFARAVMDFSNDTASNVISSFAAFGSNRVAGVYGVVDAPTLNAFQGWGVGRFPAVYAIAERFAGIGLSENVGRVASGALRIRYCPTDEGTATLFTEAHKIITIRTHRGRSGYYATNSYLKSASGSDFKYLEFGLVVDQACRTSDDGLLGHLLRSFRTLDDGTGRIEPLDAGQVEEDIRAQLKATIMDPTNAEGTLGHATAVGFSIDRTTDYLSTGRLTAVTNVNPRRPNEGVDITVGLSRQAA